MNWLEVLPKIKPAKESPLIYLVAAVVVVFLLVFWFSLQPKIKARDYLPSNTTFYYEWTDKQSWSRNNIWPFPEYIWLEPEQQLTTVEQILGEDFSQLRQIVWFQLDNQEANYYLLLTNKSLTKKQLGNINSTNSEYQLYQVNHNVYLLSQVEELVKQLPQQLSDKFTLADDHNGVNIFFNLAQAPVWLTNFAELLKNNFSQDEIFVNFDFSANSLAVWQRNSQENSNNSLTDIQLPLDFNSIFFLDQSATTKVINQQLLLSILTEFPSYYFNKFSTLLENSILLTKEDDWLLISQTDWQPLVDDYSLSFGVEEQINSLPDKTKYTELVRKADFPVQQHEFVGYQYWQVDGFFGVTIADHYYLSNSEEFIQESIIGRKYTNDLWQGCLTSDLLVTNFAFLDKKQLVKLGLDKVFKQSPDRISLFDYYNSQIKGLKLCY